MILNELGKLYSVEIVAELLDVEEQTIRKWIKEGKLKAIKLAGTTLKVSKPNLKGLFYRHNINHQRKETKMDKLTVEKTARILNDFNIIFSEGAVKSLVQRQILKTVPLDYGKRLALRDKANRGEYKASQATYGYSINPITKKLEVNEETATIVKEIFRLYLYEGWGMFKISNYLMKNGTHAPRKGKKWHQNTIKGILNNQVYWKVSSL
ncbi:recombinase family protein [Bacillus sp. FSL K6-1106]|uniref:recombinase family protein n=1 Tax=Bacillus sp. FSL K6-1106 TaxID=2921461 RepID=UPI0030F5E57B